MFHSEKKILFLHPQKCAGSSIRQVLQTNFHRDYARLECLPFGDKFKDKVTVHGHSSISEYIKFFEFKYGKEFFNKPQWFVFAVIRNPFDRVVSYYYHLLKYQAHALNNGEVSFEAFCLNILERHPHFKTFKQMFYYNNELMVDDFIRQESFNEDIKRVFSDKLNITNFYKEPLPHIKHYTNRTEPDYRKFYNEKTYKKIVEMFSEDLTLFNYTF